jgi:autotransporter-associated beta strand protein
MRTLTIRRGEKSIVYRHHALMKRAAVLAGAVAVVGLSALAPGASTTWKSTPTDANWLTATNWASGSAPGVTSGTTNDVATFNTALSGTIGGATNPITIDTNRAIGGITFDTANVGQYVIGSSGGNALTLSNIGAAPQTAHAVTMTSTVTNSELIAAPLKFVAPSSTNGTYSFINNSTTSSATLTISGAITANTSSSRPGLIVLDGTNTGTNTLSSALTSPGFAQDAPLIIKRGAGTWVLSGANVFSGTAITSTSGNGGIQVLDGVLSVQNNQALGTSGTANQFQTWIGNRSLTYVFNGSSTNTFSSVTGGTLELANNITLDNGVELNLSNGGTIRSNGSNTTNAGIKVSNVASTSATLSTVNAADVFTVGNAANDVTGGSSSSVLKIAGPGTIQLTQASDYAGSYSIGAGTLQLGSSTALGPATSASVAFSANSTGKLQLHGNDVTVIGLSSGSPVGTPTVENGAAGANTLTVNNTTANAYGGVLQDGSAGTLALTKGGTGSLTLSGTANTYSGGTTVSGGTLAVANGATGSATGTGNVSLGGATLTGTGTISGSISTAANSVITPGTVSGGNAGSGTLAVGSLGATAGMTFNFGLNGSNPTANLVNVTSSGGLTLPGTANSIPVNIFTPGTTNAFPGTGTFDLMQYNSSFSGLANSLYVNNGSGLDTYMFGSDGSHITLTITSSAASGSWSNPGDGVWSAAGNWTGTGTLPPQSPGDSATFGDTGASHSVTLDANETVGNLTFSSASAYTIVGSKTLTLDNSGATANVSSTLGSHSVQTAIALNSDMGVTISPGAMLAISGNIANGAATHIVSLSGSGTLALSGTNTYGPAAGSVGTVLGSGTLQVGSNAALASGDVSVTGNAALQSGAAGLTVSNNIGVTSGNTLTVNANGNTFTVSGVISGAGAVTYDPGIVVVNTTDTYGGGSTVAAGTTLQLGDNTHAGALAGNMTISSGGTLQLGGGASSNSGSVAGTIANAGTLALNQPTATTISNVISGAGAINQNGPGAITLSGASSSFTGTTTVVSGTTLSLGNANGIGTSALTANGTFDLNGNSPSLTGISGTGTIDQLTSAATTTLSSTQPGSTTFSGAIKNTAGTVNLTMNGTGGTLHLTGTETYTGTTNANTGTISLDSGGVINAGTISASGNGSFQINGGALTSSGTSTINGGNTNGFIVNSGTASFSGTLQSSSSADGGMVKVTGGTLTVNDLKMQRTNNSTSAASTTSGIVVTGGTINAGSIELGTSNSSASLNISGGSVTSTGPLLVGNQTTGGRGGIVGMSGGTLNVNDTASGLLLVKNNGAGTNQTANFSMTGGMANLGAITFGADNSTASGSTATVTIGSSSGPNTQAGLYVGSGGIVKNATDANMTTAVNLSGGILGATADWSTAHPIALSSANSFVATINAGDSSNNAHNITLNGPVTGTGGLTKTGNGKLILSGTSTPSYGGVTTVSAGTLEVDGGLTGTSAVNVTGTGILVANNALNNAPITVTGTLKGTGAGNGSSVTINSGGTIAPGASPGTMNTGSQTWNAGGTYQWEINNWTGSASTNYDFLNVTGAISGNATAGTYPANQFRIDITGLTAGNTAGAVPNFDPTTPRNFVIAHTSAGIGLPASAFFADPTNFANNNPLNGRFTTSIVNSGNDLQVSFTPPIISLTAPAPSAGFGNKITNGSGADQGTFNPNTPIADSLNPATDPTTAAFLNDISNGTSTGVAADYVQSTGLSPSDVHVYFLKLKLAGADFDPSVQGQTTYDADLAQLIGDINASGGHVGNVTAARADSADPGGTFFPGYDLLITEPTGGSGTENLGFNMNNEANLSGLNFSVTDIAAVPEPATGMAALVIGAVALLPRRRRAARR